MFPKLQHDERWLADFRHYQKEVSEIEDPNLQKDLTEAFLELKAQVEYVDQHHEQIFITGRLPTETGEFRTAISKYRQKLDEGLAAYKNKPRPSPR
jgi:glutaredoxin 2